MGSCPGRLSRVGQSHLAKPHGTRVEDKSLQGILLPGKLISTLVAFESAEPAGCVRWQALRLASQPWGRLRLEFGPAQEEGGRQAGRQAEPLGG